MKNNLTILLLTLILLNINLITVYSTKLSSKNKSKTETSVLTSTSTLTDTSAISTNKSRNKSQNSNKNNSNAKIDINNSENFTNNSNSINQQFLTSMCDPLCFECETTDKTFNINCKVCKVGVYLYKSKCYESCPIGTYPDDEWQVCRTCDELCPVCWGPLSSMCGSKKGVTSRVVLIENEIKAAFPLKEFSKDYFNQWLKNIKIILSNAKKEFIFGFKEDISRFTQNELVSNSSNSNNNELNGLINGHNDATAGISNIDLSPSEVYGNSKIKLDLPFGSFSKDNGVFIPIPSYLSSSINYVRNHWIYIKGQWNGYMWLSSWNPVLPTFLIESGDKTKIYYENEGYWLFDYSKSKYSIYFLMLFI